MSKSVYGKWKPIETCPLNYTLVLLAVAIDDSLVNEMEEALISPIRTIGCGHEDELGRVCWDLAGWSWDHDCFTEGHGTPIAWMPLPEPPEIEYELR